jgi:hypothetical protein
MKTLLLLFIVLGCAHPRPVPVRDCAYHCGKDYRDCLHHAIQTSANPRIRTMMFQDCGRDQETCDDRVYSCMHPMSDNP